MKIDIKDDSATVTYEPWKFGDTLIRENGGSIRLMLKRKPQLVRGFCNQCGMPASDDEIYACAKHSDHNGGDGPDD